MDIFDRANEALSGAEAGHEVDSGLEGLRRSKLRAPREPDTARQVNARKGSEFGRVDHIERPRRAPISPEMRALAIEIGFQVTRQLARSTSTPVRPPSHACPPVRSLDFELGIQPVAPGYTVLAPSSTTTVLTRRLNPGWYGVLLGAAWIIGWDSGASTGDPYLFAPVTLRINGKPHPEYKNVTLQLTASLMSLNPVMIVIPPTTNTAQGSLLELIVQNTHGADSLRVASRLKGYQFPPTMIAEGIAGGMVEG